MTSDNSENEDVVPDDGPGSDAGNDERDIEARPAKKKRKRKRKRSGKTNEEHEEQEDESADDPPVDSQSSQSAKTKAAKVDRSSNSESDAVSRTVYVEGLPYDASEEQVHDFFRDVDVTSLRLPKWQDTGRLRGYGHVELATAKDFERAIEMSGKSLPGYSRYLQIRPAKPPKPAGGGFAVGVSASTTSEPSKTLLLKNLSYDATEDDIQSVMEQFGPIAEGGIRIARHNRNRQSRGFAYVEFQHLEAAVKAVKKASGTASGGIVICHRPCLVDYDHGAVRKSFRTETGRLWQKRYGKSSTDA